MSRIEKAFVRARGEGRAALVTYICAGDPSLTETEALVPELASAGADVIELGLPFGNALADGPVIQAASLRAIEAGANVSTVLDTVARIRRFGCQVPIVLMGYYNPILSFGLAKFCQRAAEVGVDGIIIPDLPLEESETLASDAASRGVDLVLLVAPTSSPERVKRIAESSRGFLYFVSVTGVTGVRAELPRDLHTKLAAARALSTIPVAVGFGIATPEQARALASHADGVIVGSALVDQLHRHGPAEAVALVTSLARALR